MKTTGLSMRRQRGLGLVELMIAITLSLMLSAALVQSYIASKSTFQMQDSMSLVQENGRFAINYLAKEIRMAGFIGCPAFASLAQFTNLAPTPGAADFPVFDPSQVIRAGTPATYAALAPDAVSDTDVLLIQKGSSIGMRLNSPSTANGLTLYENSAGLAEKDLLIVSDCSRAHLFQSSAVAGNNITTAATLPSTATAYGTDAEVMALESTVYYIKDTGRTTAGVNKFPIYSLYMKTRGAGSKGVVSNAVELVEGVQNMKVEFGMDTDGDANRAADVYKAAKDIVAADDWKKVVSVRLSLLLQGVDEKAMNGGEKYAQEISFDGKDIAADGRLRQVFNTTVAIRNRLP